LPVISIPLDGLVLGKGTHRLYPAAWLEGFKVQHKRTT
jgi:hypothetical protein